jgi:hypothetical protein
MMIRSCGMSEATLIAATSSVSNSMVSALRRSGRFKVTTVIRGVCFSMRRTGIAGRLKGYKVKGSSDEGLKR